MTHTSNDLLGVAIKLFWTILFSLVPAVLLGMDFGFSVGIGYFVVTAAILSVHYDVQDTRKAVQEIAKGRQS
ncbi:hypothetical protein [Luteimonas sp. YGD11-2]|uniref:hypothetical protein n=1 Tax=Luteimonas sp. YGD11-2 TaxID=2508168 RepID=UPI00100BDF91|nr:hypothetical protein [Luteimonas sp. YGD11-2]